MGDGQLSVRFRRVFSGISIRGVLLSIPGLAVLVVGAAWFWLRSDVSVHGARVFVGPYPDRVLAFRALAVRASGGQEFPLSVPVQVRVRDASGATHETQAVSDADGIAEFNLDLPFVPGAYLDLELTELAGKGEHAPLAAMRWAQNASATVALTERGAWLPGKQTSPPTIEVGLRDGVAAVPFEGELVVRVSEQGRGLKDVPLTIELSGAHRTADTAVVTDANGFARVGIIPDEHHAEVTVSSRVEDATATFWGVIPVVPGAMRVEEFADTLRVLSAVPRARAFVNLIADGRIVQVLSTPLKEQGALFVGEVRAPARAAHSWAVVSSEPDAQSLALVGWPLGAGDDPGVTYDLRMRLGVDGVTQNRLRQTAAHARVRRGVDQFLFSVMILESGLLLLHLRRSQNVEVSDVSSALEATLQPANRGWLWVTLGVVALGLLALGVFLFVVSG